MPERYQDRRWMIRVDCSITSVLHAFTLTLRLRYQKLLQSSSFGNGFGIVLLMEYYMLSTERQDRKQITMSP